MAITEDELTPRIEQLETRLMHQEATLDELTRTLLAQEQLVRKQGEVIRRLEMLIQRLSPADTASAADNTPPPHY
ncbi:MAG: SlyX family protein [Thiohalobacterales bacterium]